MRSRRKKNLDSRLKSCKDYLIDCASDERNYKEAIKNPKYIDVKAVFGNDNPLEIEVGCGKGRFACEIAKRNPDINYIAVEKAENVIVTACESAREQGIKNLRFVCSGAEFLQYFLPDKSVDRIYLNFSCPYPKNSYANNRLTNRKFLEIYKAVLSDDGEIHQKTDNMQLFEYSIEQLSDFGYTIKNVSLNLHSSGFKGNIVTEYEQRFSSMGYPIYRLEAYLKHS